MKPETTTAKPRVQCKTCPWRKGASVDAIPNYRADLHRALTNTIAEPGSLRGMGGTLRVMACHYSTEGAEIPCVGWLANQLGPGNNLALRLRACSDPTLADFATEGPQHERFEDTLPKRARPEPPPREVGR